MNTQETNQQEQRNRQFLWMKTQIIMPEEGLLLDPLNRERHEWEENDEYRDTFLPRNFL